MDIGILKWLQQKTGVQLLRRPGSQTGCDIFWLQHGSTKMTGASCVQTEKGFFTLLFGTFFSMTHLVEQNSGFQLDETDLENQWDQQPDFAGIFWSGLNMIGGMPVPNCRWGEFWSLLVHVCNASSLILSGHHTIFQFWIVWMLFWHVFLNCFFEISNPSWLSQLAHSFWLGQHHFDRSNSHDIIISMMDVEVVASFLLFKRPHCFFLPGFFSLESPYGLCCFISFYIHDTICVD